MTVYLRPAEAGQRVHLSQSTLAKMRLRGDGPPFKKVGGKVVYPEMELEAWLEAKPLQTSTSSAAGGSSPRRGRPPRQQG